MLISLNDFSSIEISRQQKTPLYVQLYTAILSRIQNGQLTPGYLLPPVRKLAAYLKLNPGTVVSAYRELEQNGYIRSRAGAGSFVAELPSTPEQEPDESQDLFEFPSTELDPADNTIDMSSISLNPDIISIEQFKKQLLTVLDRDQGHAFSYQESQGFGPLRQSIAAHLATAGIHTTARRLQIISGAQQGIDITARALLSHGDYVFTESPTYPGAIAAFRSRGARIIDIPLTPAGIDLQALEDGLRRFRPKLLYIMPNLQNPTGITYDQETRSRLMGLARYYNAYVLEDDYISELSYTNQPLRPLKAIDRDDRIIYLKSFSKIFMPGLRLAFLTMPAALAGRILQVKRLADLSTSGLTQRVFDLYLREGIWRQHIRDIRRIYRTHYQYTEERARALLPESVELLCPRGGLSFWLTLPAGISSILLCKAAAQNGLMLTDGSGFYPHQTDTSHIRLSFATLSPAQIEAGLKILSRLLS